MDSKSNKMMIFLVIWSILLVGMYIFFPKGPAAKNGKGNELKPADVMYQQAEKHRQKAGTDKKALGKVANEYQAIVKAYPGTEYAAKSLLQKGMIYHKNLNNTLQAVETYTNLQRDYADKYPEICNEANKQLNSIDRENSKRPMYKVIDFLVRITGKNPKYSYFLALFFITLVFKLLTTPLSRLQFRYMKDMQRIQPLVKELQDKYKNDSKVLGEKLMALYKEHNVNPFSSCLPMLVQLPILWILYGMVRLYQVQFVNGEFLWISSNALSHAYPTIVAANLALPDIPLLIIYAISMYISQKLMVVDPTQAEQQKMMTILMPIIFAVMFKGFPSAFMLYWLLQNIISTIQQYYILKPMKGDNIPPTAPSKPTQEKTEIKETQPKSLPTSPGKARRRKKKYQKPLPAL